MLLSDFVMEKTSLRAEFAFGRKRKNTKTRSDKGKKRLKRAAMIGAGVLGAAALGAGGVALARRMKKKPVAALGPASASTGYSGKGVGRKEGVAPSAKEKFNAERRASDRNSERERQNISRKQNSDLVNEKLSAENNYKRLKGRLALPPARN